jgi:hypothetical protein
MLITNLPIFLELLALLETHGAGHLLHVKRKMNDPNPYR